MCQKCWLFCLLVWTSAVVNAQTEKVTFISYDGALIAGYVNNGAFLNCTGPNISIVRNHTRLLLGMLPSLRFKQDHSNPHNAFVTPALGVGLTFCYKALALQLPAYYNAKTATASGQWHLGIGIGLRMSHFNRRNPKP